MSKIIRTGLLLLGLMVLTTVSIAWGDEVCAPTPDGSGCQPTACPIAGRQCLPSSVRFNPATGQLTVNSCDCLDPQECHVESQPGAVPSCVGACPNAAQVCQQLVTTNPDGTVDVQCQCVCTSDADCGDGVDCTVDTCVSGVCQYSPAPPGASCTATDGNDCTVAACDGTGTCEQCYVNECSAICRTGGFWATHARANPKKSASKNITQAVINAGGGSLDICGECINATVPINNAASAVEAMCVRPTGNTVLQLARQLTAAALNCIISGGGSDCSCSETEDLFADCNNACIGAPSTHTVAQCVALLDCLNDGGEPLRDGFCKTGTCANGEPCNLSTPCADLSACTPTQGCDDQLLVNQSLRLNFDPPGPAGSEVDCNSAINNRCAVLPLTCSTTSGSGEACCATDSCP